MRRWRHDTRGHEPLITRSRSDPAAFDELYRRYSARVLVFCTRQVLDAEVALDLTSETFAEILSKRGQFRGSTDEEQEAWLFAIARTQVHRYWRRGATERRALSRYGIETPSMSLTEIERVEELAGLADRGAVVMAALAELPDDQQDAIRLRIVEELDYETVAARTGVSSDVARARVSRGLRRLARSMQNDDLARNYT